MAFDKYVLGILSFYLTQALWGLWLCQFCSKVSFVSAFSGPSQSCLYAQYQPEVCYDFCWDCTAGRWMWPRKRLSWTLELLNIFLGAPSLWHLRTSSPFLCLLLVMRLGSVQWSGPDEIFLQRCSTPLGFWDWKGQYPGCRSKAVSFNASQISQDSLPFFGSLFGENLSSKRSAFRRNPPLGMLHFSCSWKSDSSFRWGGSVVGCKDAAILLYYQYTALPSTSQGISQGVAGQCFGPAHIQPWLCHTSPCWISAWYLFSGLLWLGPRAPHASMQKVMLSGFTLQIMQPFQTHLSPRVYSWQK